MTLKKLAAIAVAGLSLLGGQALAQTGPEPRFYVGGALGWADVDIDAPAGATTFSSDNNTSAWKAFGGFNFSRHFGLELGYVDFGRIDFAGTVGAVPIAGSADVTAWTLNVVGTIPIQNFDIFGKAGLYHWKTKGSAFAGGVGLVADDDGNDPMFGVGVRYNFTRNFGVQLEAEHFSGSDKINLFSVGLRLRF